MQRHPELKWENVQQRLENNQDKLWSLNEMEETDGEPDVIDYNAQTGEYIFVTAHPKAPKEDVASATTKQLCNRERA